MPSGEEGGPLTQVTVDDGATIVDDERLSLGVWASLVADPQLADAGADSAGASSTEGSSRTPHGPRLPPGWFPDINDPVLLSYDPYFRSFTGASEGAAAPIFRTAEDRYYVEGALPVCRTSVHSRRAVPSLGIAEVRDGGRTLLARRPIRAGEIICMDTSLAVVVESPLVYLYPPPAAASVPPTPRTREAGTALAGDFIRKLSAMSRGTELLAESSSAQFLASLLLHYGDFDQLPRVSDWRRERHNIGAVPESQMRRTIECERIIKRIGEEGLASISANRVADGFVAAASLFLLCLPPVVLSSTGVSRTERGSAESQATPSRFGFVARLGLSCPARLAALLGSWHLIEVRIQVPDLPTRFGVFPYLRHFRHECRPNSCLFFLDSPATHRFGSTGRFSYDTVANGEGQGAGVPPIWGVPCTTRVFLPSVAVVVAIRDVAEGEVLSLSCIPSTYMAQPQRVRAIRERYRFSCDCRWCVREPDLPRAFRCPRCPRHLGVICPTGDGMRFNEWVCFQCGYVPEPEEALRCLSEERALAAVKADKAVGLTKLLSSDYVHYTHAVVFNKLDSWSEQAWQDQDATLCMACIEAMMKCTHRVLDPCDPHKAQLHEFLAQVHHALGNAHTARYEYFVALQLRLRAGTRYAHWTRKTRFMAAEKSLVDFLDSK